MKLEGFEIPIRSDATFICFGCCEAGVLEWVNDEVVFDCPHHLRLTFANAKLISVETKGRRN